ncbi:Aspartate aminotransferase [Aphelenchoides bicaudatus]|nr:Aspartate aminotransferase [Aphelenchoides bicaudatus]
MQTSIFSKAFCGSGKLSQTIACFLHGQKRTTLRAQYIMSNRRPSIFAELSPLPSNLSDVPADGINLSVETYRDKNGKPYPLPVVRLIEKQLAHDQTIDHDYLDNALGFAPFVEQSTRLLFNTIYNNVKDNVSAVQSVSSTGAIRLGFEFMFRVLNCENVMISNPTYSDYDLIAKNAGIPILQEYPYYDYENRKLAFEPMLHCLSQAKSNSIVVLQIGHNPTGLDPTYSQWRQIAEVIKDRNLIPFFDVANVGLCSGSVVDDTAPLKLFVDLEIEFFVAQSFSKNFGLYNERVGTLIVFSQDKSKMAEIKQYLHNIARSIYTNPPIHGARIVTRILQANYYKQQWAVEVQMIYKRTMAMRKALRQQLEEKQTPGTWNHLTDSHGLFVLLGLNDEQLHYLTKKYNIYTGTSGRINVSMLNEKNIERIASAIDDAARSS